VYNNDVLVFSNLHLAFGVFNILNNSLQEVGLPTLVINLIFFFSLRLFFYSSPQHPPPPKEKYAYLKCERKFAKYILNTHLLHLQKIALHNNHSDQNHIDCMAKAGRMKTCEERANL
jgi:hypothetical protein